MERGRGIAWYRLTYVSILFNIIFRGFGGGGGEVRNREREREREKERREMIEREVGEERNRRTEDIIPRACIRVIDYADISLR